MSSQVFTDGRCLFASTLLRHFCFSDSGLRLDAQLLPAESAEQSISLRQRPHSMAEVLDMQKKRAGWARLDIAIVPIPGQKAITQVGWGHHRERRSPQA